MPCRPESHVLAARANSKGACVLAGMWRIRRLRTRSPEGNVQGEFCGSDSSKLPELAPCRPESHVLAARARPSLWATKPDNVLRILQLVANHHWEEIVTGVRIRIEENGTQWWADSYSLIGISTDLAGWWQNSVVNCNEILSRSWQTHSNIVVASFREGEWKLDEGRACLLVTVLAPEHLNLTPANELKHRDAVVQSSFTAAGGVVIQAT